MSAPITTPCPVCGGTIERHPFKKPCPPPGKLCDCPYCEGCIDPAPAPPPCCEWAAKSWNVGKVHLLHVDKPWNVGQVGPP